MDFNDLFKKYTDLDDFQGLSEVPEDQDRSCVCQVEKDPDDVRGPEGEAPGSSVAGKRSGDIPIRIADDLQVALADLPDGVAEQVARRLTFVNPLWARAKRAGTLTPEITRELNCHWKTEDGMLHTTRGFASDLLGILQAHRVLGYYKDHTSRGATASFRFQGSLYAYQREAVNAIHARRFGTIIGGTGSGKKVIAMYLAAERRVSVLVITQTKSSAYQWLEQAGQFLGLSGLSIGLIGDGKQDRGRLFTVAIQRSLHRIIDEISNDIGFLIVDGCDQCNLNTFFKFVRHIPSAYMLGLASARRRADHLTAMMHAYMGPRLHEIDMDRVYRESTIVRPRFTGKETGFDYDFRQDWKELVGALSVDQERNRQLIVDVLAEVAMDKNTRVVVMVERLIHLEALRKAFEANHRDCALVSGQTSEADLTTITEAFDKGKLQIICVTYKSFGVLDVKRITHLFVASPTRTPQFLCQAVRRLMWAKPGDAAPRVYDYKDKPVVLQGSYRGRMRVYRDMGVVMTDDLNREDAKAVKEDM